MKPVDPMVLLARVRALLRRAERGSTASAADRRPDLTLGALRISETSREVWLHGQAVPLTTQEFELLSLLAHRAGELVSRDEVFRTMRGIDYDGLDRSIDGRVSKLRRKLGDDATAPTRIKTVWGKGYLLVPDAWEIAV
jgi:DNA-binding response OmpR family regulator